MLHSSGPANKPRKLKGQRADITSEKSSQELSTLTFFPVICHYVLWPIKHQAHIFLTPSFSTDILENFLSQRFLVASPVPWVFSYFETKGYITVHVCLNQCVTSDS